MSGLDLILPDGGAQMPFVVAYPAVSIGAPASISANYAYLTRVRVAKPITINTLSYYVGTASGNVDLGIYTWDGSQFVRAVRTGSTASAGSGVVQSIATAAAYTVIPFTDYWLAFAADNATITAARAGTSVPGSVYLKQHGAKTSAWSTGLPATIDALVASPSVWVVAEP